MSQWPVLIMRTPKGWSGPKIVDGEYVEGSFHAHQIPLMAAKTNKDQLADLQKWLLSYGPAKLFTKTGDAIDSIKSIIPVEPHKKLGQRVETYNCHEPLNVPDWRKFGVEKGAEESCMKAIGNLLDQALVDNPKSLRIFSPDELVSNKLDAVFNHTGRDFQWDEFSHAKGGRVIEILSEHTCQGFLQGYTLTGRTGLFPSYESFLGIIHTMMVQYSKFNKMARETTWRTDISSINYIETSTWTRQEHNGFSHQNPSFIGAVLNLKPSAARVYLPPDAVSMISGQLCSILTSYRTPSSPPSLTAYDPRTTLILWLAQSNLNQSSCRSKKQTSIVRRVRPSGSSLPQKMAFTPTSSLLALVLRSCSKLLWLRQSFAAYVLLSEFVL